MPLDMEAELVYSLLVRQVVHLPEDQASQGGVQLFGRAPRTFGKIGGNSVNGQLPEDLFSDNADPGRFHKSPSFGTQVAPGIGKVVRLVIARMKHVTNLQTLDILDDSYHFKEQMPSEMLQYRKLF